VQWTKVHPRFHQILPWTWCSCLLQGRRRCCWRHVAQLRMWLGRPGSSFLGTNGDFVRWSWLSRHRGLSNLVETILTDLREVLGCPKISTKPATGIAAANWANYVSTFLLKLNWFLIEVVRPSILEFISSSILSLFSTFL
jgi:hypothetical protein